MISPTEFIAEPDAIMLDLRVASGEAAVKEYLRAVVALPRMLRNPGVRAGLQGAPDKAGFRALLSRGAARRR